MWLGIWMFPKMVASPNHPFWLVGFSIINHPFWGTLFLETPISFQQGFVLHSLKLTRPMKMGHPKRKRLFQPSIFRCYVSLPECKWLWYFLDQKKMACTGWIISLIHFSVRIWLSKSSLRTTQQQHLKTDDWKTIRLCFRSWDSAYLEGLL